MSAPADFIPVAEESALIVEIGAWALTQACQEATAVVGLGDGPFVSVNLASRQLAQPELPALVRDVLAASGLPAGRLRLELKERMLQSAPKPARRNLEALREIGVGLVLDNFGTGYSSLRDMPVHAVKIDRSFVGGVTTSRGDTAIVSAIISLSAALGIDAVAEGVENEEQAALLTDLGCPLAQGFLFGAPGPRITSAV
jgi:EAL domain-containing protein (putative c-di-GMP-specific phosphodiesterase class I)